MSLLLAEIECLLKGAATNFVLMIAHKVKQLLYAIVHFSRQLDSIPVKAVFEIPKLKGLAFLENLLFVLQLSLNPLKHLSRLFVDFEVLDHHHKVDSC